MVELQPGDVVDGPVEERVDGRGKRWLGTTHKLQRCKPLLLDPKRRHATAPWTGERVVLVADTVDTLGKVPECHFNTLESPKLPTARVGAPAANRAAGRETPGRV